MGPDDRNEGPGPGECVGHVWTMQGAPTLFRVFGMVKPSAWDCGLMSHEAKNVGSDDA